MARDASNLSVAVGCDEDPGITLELENRGNKATKVAVTDAYTKRKVTQRLEPVKTMVWHWSLEDSYGWYDLTVAAESDGVFERRLAGHVENGKGQHERSVARRVASACCASTGDADDCRSSLY